MKKKLVVSTAALVLLLGLGYSVVKNYMTTKAATQLQKDLLAQHGAKAMLDPFTSQVICKEPLVTAVREDVAKKVDNKLVTFSMCGESVTAVKSVAAALQRANAASVKEKGACIKVISSFRTNLYQQKISGEEKPKAGCPCCSFHLAGRAFDVENWHQTQKYLWEAGFQGGSHGLYADPWHFSRNEFPEATGMAKVKNWLWIGKNSAKTRLSRLER